MNIYIPFKGFEKELETELVHYKNIGPYYLSSNDRSVIWAQDVLYDIQEIKINSIGDASKKLKAIHSHWVDISFENFGRSKLIQEKLNYYKPIDLKFLGELPKQKFGLWLLKDTHTVIASHKTEHRIPKGEINFLEDKKTAPTRAYLKLWELFTMHNISPQKGEVVIDMGSCPGGWSWVLSELGCHVLSVDKAPLDAKIAKYKNIKFIKKDAFKLDPKNILTAELADGAKLDWFFSDIICEPKRLLDLVKIWQPYAKNFVCTIKFKGTTDFEVMREFLEFENSRIIHLFHNKHEVTWIWKNL